MSKTWNNSQTLSNRKESLTLSKQDKFISDSLFKINVICDHSEELQRQYFSNKIPAIDLNSPIRNNINNILNLDGKEISINSLPFDTCGGYLEINYNNRNRLTQIFDLYNIGLEEETILKCNCKNDLNILYHTKNDLLRIFVKMGENKNIDILLIDPYHLVATSQYKKIFNEHKKQFKFCYSRLKNLLNLKDIKNN